MASQWGDKKYDYVGDHRESINLWAENQALGWSVSKEFVLALLECVKKEDDTSTTKRVEWMLEAYLNAKNS